MSVPAMLDDAALAACEARCAGHVAMLAGDAAHDAEHVRRVVRTARALARAEGARLEIVLPAAWLHDVVAVPKDAPHRAAASRLAGAEAARLLRAWGYPAELVPAVVHAIEAHSFSAGIAPATVEARVVRDADRLDALGAVGLARCLMLGGAMGRQFYVPDDPFCEARVPDDAASALDHLYTKLLRLEAAMQTGAGRAMARERTAFLETFLGRLRAEIGGRA